MEAPGLYTDYLPGENVSILYLNTELNYEDSVMVSSRYVDFGGFSTVSVCKFLLPASSSDSIPPIGSRPCRKVNPWWKSPCAPRCKHNKEWVEESRYHRTVELGRGPTGVLLSSRMTSSGDYDVRLRSFQQLSTGDKVTTGHGQKGVVTIVPVEDMPYAITSTGEKVIPDIIMAMSSVVTRQTDGQLYETSKSLESLREGRALVVPPASTCELSEDVIVRCGITGRPFITMLQGVKVPQVTRATLGYVRVHNQTQMVRERLFTSHRQVGPGTLRTPVRRTKGGGVALGEMEIQAAVASGLTASVNELLKRGDQVLVSVCTSCQRLRLLCGCTDSPQVARVTLPYDTVVFDCISAIVHNGSNVYTLAVDT